MGETGEYTIKTDRVMELVRDGGFDNSKMDDNDRRVMIGMLCDSVETLRARLAEAEPIIAAVANTPGRLGCSFECNINERWIDAYPERHGQHGPNCKVTKARAYLTGARADAEHAQPRDSSQDDVIAIRDEFRRRNGPRSTACWEARDEECTDSTCICPCHTAKQPRGSSVPRELLDAFRRGPSVQQIIREDRDGDEKQLRGDDGDAGVM